MSFVPRQNQQLLSSLGDLFPPPANHREITFGAEDERFYLHPDGSIATPRDTQRFLQSRLAQGGRPDFEHLHAASNEHRTIARVTEDRVTWSLETAGVIELSTRPYGLSALNQFGDELAGLISLRDHEMAQLGLSPCPFSAPPTLSTADAEARMVDSARLRSLHRAFVEKHPDHPARFTLFQEAVAQISIAPRSLVHAGTLMRRAVQWAPLFYAATDNSAGYAGGFSLRSRKWAKHNDFVPRGKERAGCPDVLLDLAFGASEEGFVERYLNHVEHVPMVFFYDEQGEPCFHGEPSFDELRARGLGTVANAVLALSLCWFDARLMPLDIDSGQWLRIEVRSLDGGGAKSTWLAALLVCGAIIDDVGGAMIDELFMSTGIDRAGYVQARASLPERGLDVPFGRTRLQSLLPRFCDIAAERCLALGVSEDKLAALYALGATMEAPATEHRRRFASEALMRAQESRDHKNRRAGRHSL
jgi:hypothetical protein